MRDRKLGRTSYTADQVRVMEKIFAEDRYPGFELLEQLSSDLEIPVKRIKVNVMRLRIVTIKSNNG